MQSFTSRERKASGPPHSGIPANAGIQPIIPLYHPPAIAFDQIHRILLPIIRTSTSGHRLALSNATGHRAIGDLENP